MPIRPAFVIECPASVAEENRPNLRLLELDLGHPPEVGRFLWRGGDPAEFYQKAIPPFVAFDRDVDRQESNKDQIGDSSVISTEKSVRHASVSTKRP